MIFCGVFGEFLLCFGIFLVAFMGDFWSHFSVIFAGVFWRVFGGVCE